MARLTGKVAIVTGAAMGMGAAIAKRFLEEGGTVVATDISEDALQKTVAEYAAIGTIIGIKHDVSSKEGWHTVVEEAVRRFDQIDILVNNAGITTMKPFLEQTEQDWDRIVAVNGKSVFFGMQTVIPAMKKAGGGSIVNLSSIAAMIAMGASAYGASKATVRTLSRSAAVDFAKDNIRVNSVHPGIMATPMTKDIQADDKFSGYFIASTPLQRLGQPEEVANAVLFLASDEASFVTGVELVVDGGFSAR